ncbi:ATP-binding protein [Azospirillum argentinense]|uniref:ATP-binding protein n=1 Tax=Azospirillum argentinense TaxID=2970906 RepID=UPI0035572488
MFFQLVSHRYERGSMLVTSNRSVSEWGTVFGDPDPPSPLSEADFPVHAAATYAKALRWRAREFPPK